MATLYQAGRKRDGGSVKKKSTDNLLNDYHLLSYDVIDSTNAEARRLAEGGASHGAVIWAKRQTAGRGRLQREWISENGNLYVSILLEPKRAAEACAELSFVAAVAAAQSLKPIVSSDTISCKWPNDILLGNEKLGGILLESFETDSGTKDARRWVIVGVGINVENYPDNVSFPATSLHAAGVEIISAKIVLSRFVYHFIQNYDLWHAKGFAPIRKEWLSLAYGIGKPVEVRLPHERINGVCKGIDKHGLLEIQLPGGRKKAVAAGDVVFG